MNIVAEIWRGVSGINWKVCGGLRADVAPILRRAHFDADLAAYRSDHLENTR